jgi:hypothetical protein
MRPKLKWEKHKNPQDILWGRTKLKWQKHKQAHLRFDLVNNNEKKKKNNVDCELSSETISKQNKTQIYKTRKLKNTSLALSL